MTPQPLRRGFAAAYAHAIVRWRWPVLVVSLALTVTLALGMGRLGFNPDYRAFFDSGNPQLAAFEHMQRVYTKSDSVLFALQPAEGGTLTEHWLDVLRDTTRKAWMIPHSVRVDSIANYQHTVADADHLMIGDLVRQAPGSAAEVERIRRIVMDEPSLLGHLISRDGRTAGVLVTLHPPDGDPMAVAAITAHAERIAADLRAQHPTLRVALTGLAPISNAYPQAAQRDIAVLVPAMALAIVVLLAVTMRTASGVVGTSATIVLSSLTALGFAGWTGILLTPPATMAPLVVLTVAVADCLHLLSGVRQIMATGIPRRQAAEASLAENLPAITITSVTTAIGLLGLNFAAAPPYRDLGNMAAVGVLVAWTLAITFLPAWAAIVPMRAAAASKRRPSPWRGLAPFIGRHANALFLSGLVLAGLGIPIALRLEIDDRIVEYFDESMPIRIDSDFVLDHLTGIYQLEFSVDSGQPGGIADPDYLARLDAFTLWLRGQPEVAAVSSFTDSIKNMNRALHGDDPAARVLPGSREQAAQYVLLYEYSLPYGLTLNSRVNLDKSATRLVASLGRLSTRQIIAVKERAETWLAAHGLARSTEGTGVAVMFAYLSHHNIHSMLTGTVVTLGLVLVAMLVFLADFRLGAVSLLPNLIPVILAFAVWGVIVGEVGTAASMVTVVALGLIVDPTAHILRRYRHARDGGAEPMVALGDTLAAVAPPIVISSLVLVAGFLVLSFSPFKMNADLGLLSALMILLGMVFDLLFLPASILVFNRLLDRAGMDPVVVPETAE